MKIIEAAAFWFSFAYKAIDLFIERYIIILCNSPKYIAHALYNKQTIVLLKWEVDCKSNFQFARFTSGFQNALQD